MGNFFLNSFNFKSDFHHIGLFHINNCPLHHYRKWYLLIQQKESMAKFTFAFNVDRHFGPEPLMATIIAKLNLGNQLVKSST